MRVLFIRYVPDVVKGEFANIGVVLREAGQCRRCDCAIHARLEPRALLDLTPMWQLLESLEAENADRLERGSKASRVNAKPMLELLETRSRTRATDGDARTLAESLPVELEQLMRMYVEPLKDPTVRRKRAGEQRSQAGCATSSSAPGCGS